MLFQYGRYFRLLTFLLLACPAMSHAETPSACFAPVSGQQTVKDCTSIIDDPVTDPFTRSDAYGQRGMAYSMLKRSTDALADYDKALEINPASAFTLNNRAWELFRWKGSTEGLPDVEQSLQIEPKASATWDTRAHLRQLLGNHEGALYDYQFAILLGGVQAVRTYQCGLKQRGLYHGKIDGLYSDETRVALKTCASPKTCDPLPDGIDRTFENMSCGEITS